MSFLSSQSFSKTILKINLIRCESKGTRPRFSPQRPFLEESLGCDKKVEVSPSPSHSPAVYQASIAPHRSEIGVELFSFIER